MSTNDDNATTDAPAIEQPTNDESATPAITAADLTPAPPAPSTEATTHVLVPNDHVNFLHRLVDDVEHDVEGAEDALIHAFRRVFERTA